MNTETAYRACEEITRREAKNFGYGIRLLRPPERQALSSVYALARRIDDIGDGTAPPAQKLVELAQVRDSLTPSRRTPRIPCWWPWPPPRASTSCHWAPSTS
jgi:phytoene/squalene synthetase